MDTERTGEEVRHRHVETLAGSSSQQDSDATAVNSIGNGTPPIHEPREPTPPLVHYGPNFPASRQRNRRTYGIVGSRAAVAYAIICVFYIAITLFVHVTMNSYPTPKLKSNSDAFEFVEEIAREHLESFNSMGPRVAGSKSNMLAQKYIVETVNEISRHAMTHLKIDIDLQRVSGSFTLDFINVGLGEFTSVYQNLTNIVVKLSPLSRARNSLLVNCHFDTVVDSPGAGDDATSCAVMLEMLRALTQKSDLHLMHNIIFLFNGAEENILQTSHGFITQHPWASNIRAFVNLDSAGAGGWEMVFQTGPEHPWLIKAYVESAPYPHATCIGQEIFQTGMIPSDTDYRIFRDYGHIPGIDIAHTKNGYVYHTRNDKAEFIPDGCLQRGGENVMALVMTLASSYKLSNPGDEKHGSMVFFDFLGFFTVAYPKRMALLLNWATIVFIYLSLFKRLYRERESLQYLRLTLIAMLCQVATWIVILVVGLSVAVGLAAVGRQLSYYTHTLNIVWLFVLPSVTAAIVLHLGFKKTIFKGTDPELLAPVLQEATLMLWSLILGMMTWAGLMSSFVPLLCVLAPAITFTVLEGFGFKSTNVLFTLTGSLVPSLYAVYLDYTLVTFLVPIMGRRGLEGNPDILVAALACLPVLICLPYHIGFVYTHKRVERVVTTTVAVFLLALTAVVYTPCGFPYSSSSTDVAPQRAIIVHVNRNFHSQAGNIVSSDSDLWYLPLDSHSTQYLAQYSPRLMTKSSKVGCDGVYCARPYLYPMLRLTDAQKTLSFPASRLKLTNPVTVHLTQREILSDSRVRLHLALTGPSHISVYVTEWPGAKVVKWSFGREIPVQVSVLPGMKEPTYFIYYSHSGNTTWDFTMDVEVENPKSVNGQVINIGFAGHYLHGPNQVSADLKAFERHLPDWISPVTWSATYDEFIF